MKNIGSILSSLALLIGAGGVVVIAYLALPQFEKYVRMESVRTCGQISKFTQNIDDGASRAEYPIQDVYQECLSTLGVSQ